MATNQSEKWWGSLILPGLKVFRVRENFNETPHMKTIRFAEQLDGVPGQFVMVWVPGVDEFPMSLSYTGNRFGITYQIVGDGTRALSAKLPGDKIGIRGPYGNGFTAKGKNLLLVGGGAGMAPIGPLVELARSRKAKVDLVLAAKTRDELLFEKRSIRSGASVHVSTDDGTKGFKGLATELAESVMAKKKFDLICACGPEKMISKMLDIASKKKIPMEASLERLMKCGIGICDSCALDGKHVCKDGPVFLEKELRLIDEFGKTKLDAAGRKVPI